MTQPRTIHPAYQEAFNRTWGVCAALMLGLPMVTLGLLLCGAMIGFCLKLAGAW